MSSQPIESELSSLAPAKPTSPRPIGIDPDFVVDGAFFEPLHDDILAAFDSDAS